MEFWKISRWTIWVDLDLTKTGKNIFTTAQLEPFQTFIDFGMNALNVMMNYLNATVGF